MAPVNAADKAWQLLANPYFRALTNADHRRAMALLDELDRFRVGVQTVTSARMPPGTPPATVVIFGSIEEFRAHAWSRDIAGYAMSYVEGVGDTLIVLPARGTSADEMQVIRHEYVHALNRQRLVPFPRWYEEGVAEVFSLVEIDGNKITIGLPPKDRLEAIYNAQLFGVDAWHSFDDVVSGKVAAHDRDGFGVYAQYWLLTHYLTFGAPQRKKQLDRCLILSDGMLPPLDAFRSAFGLSPEQMWEAEMRKYLRKVPAREYTLKESLAAVPFEVAAADMGEVGGVLSAIRARVEEVREREASRKR